MLCITENLKMAKEKDEQGMISSFIEYMTGIKEKDQDKIPEALYRKIMGSGPKKGSLMYKARNNKGGYIDKPRKGHTDYRFNKGGLSVKTLDNRKNK